MAMHNPAHPGEILKELVLDPLGLTLTQVAENLDISRKTLSKVINGRGAITPEMAVRLEMAFAEPSADHWLKLQNAYDLWWARQYKKEYKVRPFALKVAS
jgi:antitoxin HigA-1